VGPEEAPLGGGRSWGSREGLWRGWILKGDGDYAMGMMCRVGTTFQGQEQHMLR
jgi:hypothetical protein